MKVDVHWRANVDLVQAATFYEKQSPQRAVQFLDAIDTDIERLQILGGIHEIEYGHHRMICRKFPYAIYYVKDGDAVRVMAVLDCRGNPESIRRRLTGK